MKVWINKKIEALEKGMKADVDESLRHRFIPYIQVYEFEALLFSDGQIFETEFEKSEFLDYPYLQKTLKIAPEEINDESTLKRMISIKIDAEGIFEPELTSC
ncbi:MAG: DUF4276 family protein [Cryomorphaceae bacterium]|nr:DUF4276 family protein [Cryomorphaceae bacterium]